MGTYQNVASWEARIGCRPGARALIDHAHAIGFADKGCYNPRSVLPSGAPSLHTVGRAVDLWWGDGSFDDFWAFVALLADRAEDLGIQQILFDGRGWSFRLPRWRPLTAPTDMHRDHAHIELTREAAETLTAGRLAELLLPGPPEPAPPAPPAPPEHQEIDMLHLIVTDDPAFPPDTTAGVHLIHVGDAMAWVRSGTALGILDKGGVPVVHCTVAEVTAMLQSIPGTGPAPSSVGSVIHWGDR